MTPRTEVREPVTPASGPGVQRTDDAHPNIVWAEILRCAQAWEPEARIIGNVRACDIARAMRTAIEIDRLRRERDWRLP